MLGTRSPQTLDPWTALMLYRLSLIALLVTLPAVQVAEPTQPDLHERVVGRLIGELSSKYAFSGGESWLIDSLARSQEEGRYAKLTPNLLGGELTTQLRGWTSDKHFMVAHMPAFATELEQYAKQPKPKGPAEDDPEEVAVDYGVRVVEMLDDEIGMIKLDRIAFSPGTVPRFQQALADLSDAAALIIDLRGNPGGGADTVPGLLSCFFPKGEDVNIGTRYWRPTNETKVLRTDPTMPGARYYDHPVFILTNKDTRSAAEAFAYHLRAFGKATVVGEKSSGGAHPADMVSLGDGFVALIPMGIVTSSQTGTDWECRGVPLDQPCLSNLALDRAYELARDLLDQAR